MEPYVAGKYHTHAPNQAHQYEYFLPSLINGPLVIEDKRILMALEEANQRLGELKAYGTLVPDVDFFIRMHIISEAVSSSKIEGTQTEMDEALLSEEEIDPEKRDDWKEVTNYITAMNQAIDNLNQLPVSMRLIKETHAVLMSGVRGEQKMPGEIRTSQNWIGGASITTAHFVPPHPNHLSDLLSDWEKFWHNHALSVPTLIKIAIGHYQFETIHPFLDGNGRMGRVLIILQMMERGFLKHPILYLSDFFETHRQAYYDALDRVRGQDDLEQWILFFLEAVIQTAKKSVMTFEHIIDLRTSLESTVLTLGRRAPRGQKLLEFLFTQPVTSVGEVQNLLGVNYPAANALVGQFVALNILREKTGFARNRLFIMDDYVKLFRK